MSLQGIRRRPKASQRKRIRKREDAAADRPRDVGMRIQEELFGMTEEGESQASRSEAAGPDVLVEPIMLGQVERFGTTEREEPARRTHVLFGAMGMVQAARTCPVTPLRPPPGLQS